MEATGRESTKRMRPAAAAMAHLIPFFLCWGWMRAEQRRERERRRRRARGVAASSGVVVTMTEDDMAVASAETEDHVQRILLAIDAFTRQVSEMLEAGRALFKNLAADFEDRLCSIHKERVERWEEEIRELRARDVANEQASSLLHNAQLHLFATVRHDN